MKIRKSGSKNIKRALSTRVLVIAVMVVAMVTLTGCGKRVLKHKNSDGTTSRIEYEKVSALARAPHFENNDGVVNMKFNGDSWYNARFASGDEVQKAVEGDAWILVAQSSNIDAYQQLEPDYVHSRGNLLMVLDLEGSDDAFVMFRSASDYVRNIHDYGMDIDYLITYFVDGTETVPDVSGLQMLPGIKEQFEEYDAANGMNGEDSGSISGDASAGEDAENGASGNAGDMNDSQASDNDADAESGRLIDKVCGIYSFHSREDSMEDRTYTINVVGGIICLEVDGYYDYWGAEIVPVNESVLEDTEADEFTAMMYAFSGFSFAGEYWDEGSKCHFKLTDKGVTFTIGDETVDLIKEGDSGTIHTIGYASGILTPPGLEGMWVLESDECEKCFVEFNSDGHFCLMRKIEGEPVRIFYGLIETEEDGLYTAVCERFAYGGMPVDTVLKYEIDPETSKLLVAPEFFEWLGIETTSDVLTFDVVY